MQKSNQKRNKNAFWFDFYIFRFNIYIPLFGY